MKLRSRTFLRIGKAYGIFSSCLFVMIVAYVAMLAYPQPLFGYAASYDHNFRVFAREPIYKEMRAVLDKAEEKLGSSPIYSDDFDRRLYLTGSWPMYALMTNKAYGSFGSSVPFFDNIMLTKSDVAADRMFIDRPENNTRSLSGVVAHEVTHLLLRHRYGTLKAMMLPTWKNEGYCEYVAGESTIPLEEGISRWRANPSDDTSYRYTKYNLMIKYLIEQRHMSVDDIMLTDLDQAEIAASTLGSM